MPHDLAGQTALVTGAGSGIGRAIALRLAAHHSRLVLAGRRREPLEQTASLLPLSAPPPLILSADLADPAQAQSLVDRAFAHARRLDILINNAGAAPLIPIADHTPAQLRDIFAVNFNGPAAAIARAWPIFRAQRSGCVINISSMSAVDPFPGLALYGAAKAALNTLTLGCAAEGRDFNLRAFAIAPGAVETAMLRGLFDESALSRDRTLSPEVIADLVLACIRGDHDARNGQAILAPSP